MSNKENIGTPSTFKSTPFVFFRSSSMHITKEDSCKQRRSNENNFHRLTAISDTPLVEKERLCVMKMQQCCILFDFNDPLSDVEGKEMKRDTLQELIEYVTEGKDVLTEPVYAELVNLVGTNCLRILPPSQYRDYDGDGDEPRLEPTWFHLELVYQFFMEVLVSPEFKASIARKNIDESFLLQLLPLFDSEDSRERSFLKSIIHRLYSNFTCYRFYLRTQMQNVLLAYIYEREQFRGIAELLEIFASLIQGYVLPLKEEHKKLLMKILIPLHKANGLPFYHTQLVYCIALFIEKDSSLSTSVIMGLLRYWPKTCAQKEVLFLNELEEILSELSPLHFQEVMDPVFKRIASCVLSKHFQVSEKSLLFAHNNYIMDLVSLNSAVIYPILLPCVLESREDQWNENILPIIDKAVKEFSKANKKIYNEVLKGKDKKKQIQKMKERDKEKIKKKEKSNREKKEREDDTGSIGKQENQDVNAVQVVGEDERNHEEIRGKTKVKKKMTLMRRFSFTK